MEANTACRRHAVLLLFLLVIVLFAEPSQASAHVKWFCGVIDLRAPPKSLAAVLSPMFLTRGVAFLLLVSLGSAIDAVISRRWPILQRGSSRLDFLEDIVVRLALAGCLLALWLQSCRGALGLAGDGAILTPDLLVGNRIVRLAQISIAAALVLRRTCPLAGLGLAGLYVFGFTRYGVFYMTDYVFFLGFAAYLIPSSPRLRERPAIRGWRVPILVVIIHGVSRLQLSARPRGTGALRSAASVASLYLGILVTQTALFYALQRTTWW